MRTRDKVRQFEHARHRKKRFDATHLHCRQRHLALGLRCRIQRRLRFHRLGGRPCVHCYNFSLLQFNLTYGDAMRRPAALPPPPPAPLAPCEKIEDNKLTDNFGFILF